MSDTDTITTRVLDALISTSVVTGDQLTLAREAASEEGRSVESVLLERGFVCPEDVARVLETELCVPRVDLASYEPERAALDLVPGSVASERGALPLFEIENMLTVAIGDPVDVFGLDVLAARLGVEVEPVLANPHAVANALTAYYRDEASAARKPVAALARSASAEPGAADPERAGLSAPLEGSPVVAESPGGNGSRPPSAGVEADAVARLAGGAHSVPASARRGIDLDVLAVADGKTVALLVADILDDAVAAGATAIHVAPGRDEFYVGYRVGGTLRTVASAPRSLSRPLIEGFLGLGGLVASSASRRAGRAIVRVCERDVEIGVSFVRTLAGDRLVVSLSDPCGSPRLESLGMSDAEMRTLRDVARSRGGLVVIAAPAGEGATTTYRAFLAECAAAGRAVHSVEGITCRLLDDVAQVVADGAAGSAAACLRAALEQDADVVGLDGLAGSGERDVIWSAVGRGLLAVVTVQAPDGVSAVLRMTGAGASESALTDGLAAVVSQRLVREACAGTGTGRTSVVFEVSAPRGTQAGSSRSGEDIDDAALLVRRLAESA